MKWGTLRLKTLGLALGEGVEAKRVRVSVAGRGVPSRARVADGQLTVTFEDAAQVLAGQTVRVFVG